MTDSFSDQYGKWRYALDGHRLDCGERGKPTSGFFMRNTPKGLEAVAIWKDDAKYRCYRSIYGDNDEQLTPDDIDDILASCSFYPIPVEIFEDVAYRGLPFPEEFRTRLTIAEIQAGVCWTPELGRRKIAAMKRHAAAIAAKREAKVNGKRNYHD